MHPPGTSLRRGHRRGAGYSKACRALEGACSAIRARRLAPDAGHVACWIAVHHHRAPVPGEPSVAYALQQLINGITLGMIYGLIAVGYTMVYGIIGMINFAHGDIFMIGAFLSLIALLGLASLGITAVPIALALTLVFAAALAALYGWTVERVAYRPLRGSFRLAPLISAIGMSIVLQNFVQVSQGARVKPMVA